MPIAYIGIGSNLGNRQDNCLRAIKLLQKRGITVTNRSSMYETAPWGVKDQSRFINMAIEVKVEDEKLGKGEEGAKELLKILKEIEKELGREKTSKWGPRVIDLDILFYDNLVIKGPDMEVPHPFMHEREFVLTPLCEIAPDKRHPVTGQTVREMLMPFLQSHQNPSRP
ncbi:MAG: 2-amino-4-hydroxy-6-hydroxymethyldihydropteridine diphosphokinase [Nitrospirae bacterium]|nr:2-amino-4-hydroxy-6-hydroxymethyldihydropteridine diphosphokinase [Nitrospirota bacterium]